MHAHEWSFIELARQAVQEHPLVLQKRSTSAAASADVDAAKWQRYPTPAVNSSKDNLGNITTLTSLQQPLWAGGHISGAIDAAQLRFEASEKGVGESQQQVLQQVIAAYVEAVRWTGKKEVDEKTYLQHQQLLEMIGRRVDADASPTVDRELAQARLYQAGNDVFVASQSLANALTQLSQLIGTKVLAVKPLNIDDVPVPRSEDEAIERAYAYSPIIARLTLEEEAAGADVDVQKSALWPQLAARYEHQTGNVQSYPPFTQRYLIVLNTQFGAGFSSVASVRSSVGKRDAAIQARESALRDLQQQVSTDWSNYYVSRMQVSNAVKSRENSKEVFESYARQFTAGRKSWMDVMNTVRESSSSELMVLDTNAQLLTAALRLSMWTGRISPLTLN